MPSGKVLLIVASEGYQPTEYNITKKILTEAGFDVITGSNKKIPAIAKDGTSTEVDTTLENLNIQEYNGIFFIGGPGTLEDLDNEVSYDIISQAIKTGMPLGAICIATRILAKAGALRNKRATGWNADGELKKLYEEYGATLLLQSTVIDGNVITAVGPDASQEFANQIIGMLQDNKGWG